MFLRYSSIWEDGACICEILLAREYGRIRGGLRVLELAAERAGSNAREIGRSLHVDHHVDVKQAQRGTAQHHQLGGLSRREERRGLLAGLFPRSTAAEKVFAEVL
jgi:hypothetical protein